MLSSQSKMKKKTKKSSKKLRIRERGEVLEAPEIPFDLQIEIVNRLPIKSLARFKCVSKLWYSLICSKGYLFASPPRLFITLISLVERICHNQKSVLLSLASSTSSSKSSIDFDLDMTKQGMGLHDMVVLRGLILYTVCSGVCGGGQACIYNPTIYNPTTGQIVTLPDIDSNILAEEEEMVNLNVYLFGYDPVLDQYKIVSFAMVHSKNVHETRHYGLHCVFLLEAGSSWKRIKSDHPYYSIKQNLCINGVIYYFGHSYEFVSKVMSFDVRSEEFSMIELPHEVSAQSVGLGLGLIEYNGKPTLFDYKNLKDSLVKLWVLEDIGKWSLVLQLCQLQHLFPDTISSFAVIGTTKNGEVILQPRMMSYPYYIHPSYLLYYDLHKKDLKRIDIRGISDYEMNPNRSVYYLALMDTGESIMHLKI